MDACTACGFDPDAEGMEARVRSAYFSVSRFDDAGARRDYERALDGLGQQIARGESVKTQADEVARLHDFLAEGKGWRTSDSIKMVAFVGVWLGTPIVLIVLAILLLSKC